MYFEKNGKSLFEKYNIEMLYHNQYKTSVNNSFHPEKNSKKNDKKNIRDILKKYKRYFYFYIYKENKFSFNNSKS